MRAAVMDLDGTVLDRTFRASERMVAAVAAAEASGVRCLIATGRMFRSTRRIAEQMGITAPLVCYQGALVGDPRTGEILRHVPLDVDLARELLAALGPDARVTNAYVDDELYVTEPNAEARRYAEIAGVAMHVVGDLGRWISQPTTKLVTVGDPEHLDRVRDELLPRFGQRAFIAKSLPIFLEFAAPGVSKASGMDLVAGDVGFAAADAIAFGDGENDRELLGWAGLGVAVANASPRLLADADWVVPRVEEDGVAQFLEALVAAR